MSEILGNVMDWSLERKVSGLAEEGEFINYPHQAELNKYW